MKKFISRFILWILGWKIVGNTPKISKYVIIAAPHTSNWDFVIGRSFGYILGFKAKYLAKEELFKWPFKWFFLLTGGIPVKRDKKNNLVDFTCKLFLENSELVLAIAPEGSRKKVDKWKTGFYFIALKSKVPIVLSFMDYSKKEAGIGEIIYPSGDFNKDMLKIQEFYEDISPKIPGFYDKNIF